MATKEEVFKVVTDATTTALRKQFGPETQVEGQALGAAVAVALLQLSLRYFAETSAPKAVVLDFMHSLMGVELPKGSIVEKPGGRLIIQPPPRHLPGPHRSPHATHLLGAKGGKKGH